MIISPLKTNSFVRSEETKKNIISLKDAMCTTLVLAVPYFIKTFVLECDTLGRGLGAILMQEGCPLSFTSK
jgi:hypothetical protein